MYDFTYDGEIPVYWTIILAMGSFLVVYYNRAKVPVVAF